MTREELLDQLKAILHQFDEEDTSLSVHIIFQDIGPLVGDNQEMWWDENLMMFMPTKPE